MKKRMGNYLVDQFKAKNMPDYKNPVNLANYNDQGGDFNSLRNEHPNSVVGISDFITLENDILGGFNESIGKQMK